MNGRGLVGEEEVSIEEVPAVLLTLPRSAILAGQPLSEAVCTVTRPAVRRRAWPAPPPAGARAQTDPPVTRYRICLSRLESSAHADWNDYVTTEAAVSDAKMLMMVLLLPGGGSAATGGDPDGVNGS